MSYINLLHVRQTAWYLLLGRTFDGQALDFRSKDQCQKFKDQLIFRLEMAVGKQSHVEPDTLTPWSREMLLKAANLKKDLLTENAQLRLQLEKAEASIKALEQGAPYPESEPARDNVTQPAAMLNSCMSVAPVGILLFDADLRYLFVNELLAKMNGLSVSEHLGKKFEDVVPDLYDRTAAMFRSVLQRAEAVADVVIEGTTPKEPNIMRAWRVSSFPVFGACNDAIAVGAIVQEITEQRQIEERMRAAEAAEKAVNERVVALMENLSEGLCVLDSDFRFVYVNTAGERINGMARQDMLGRTQWDVFPGSLGTQLEQKLRLAMADRLVVEFENYYAPWDTWYAIKLYPVADGGLCVLYRDITESKRAAYEQRVADERLRRVFDNQTVGMIQWNSDSGLIVEANSHFLEMVGYTPEDLAAGRLDFRAMTPPEWTAINEASIAEIRRSGRAPAIEKEYIRKDGTRVPILIAGVRFENSANEGMSVIIDLSKIKDIESRLLATEGRLRAAIGAVTSIVWTANPEGLIIGEQTSWENFTGQSLLDYQGYGWTTCVHPDDLPTVVAEWQKSIRELSVFESEQRVRRRDGKWRTCLVRALPMFDKQGKLVEWVGVHTDVTKQRQAESKVKASELRYRRLFESAKDGILILDATSAAISDANPFIADLLGYSQHELIGQELWQIGLFTDIEASKSAMLYLQTAGYIRYHDLPLKTRLGKQINVEFVSNRYGEGSDAVIQCNIRDITDRIRLEESLREQAAELLQADRRKDGFLATLAHELRNPLAPIRNGVQIMRLAGGDPATVDQTLSMMERQLGQMVHLVDDLLDVSRISRGKLELRIERVELAKVLQSAVETSRPLIESRSHQLTVRVPSMSVYLDADMTRLGQVFSNLLNNAAKYSESGGQINLLAQLQGGDVVVSVKDAGVGIAPDMLTRIFEMFTQVNHSLEKSQGGLGIGLCLVKQLVELHGGSVQAHSVGPGKGSEFVVRLPTATAMEMAPATAMVMTSPPKLESSQPGMPPVRSVKASVVEMQRRILVADDNVDSVNSLSQFLTILGHDVRTVSDGLQAVELAAQFQPEIVLLDIGMPRLNGYDACRQIRQLPGGKNAFLIALTGWGQDDDRRRSLEAGFDYHLVKPMDPGALEELLASLPARAP